MSNAEQKHFYYVDPGIGRKVSGCPYSFYKDGSDILNFISPPVGYELTHFIFEPYEDDSFYDGKIVAQYRKKPHISKIKKISLYTLSFLGIIGIWSYLVHHFFNSQHEPAPVVSNMQDPNTAPSVLPLDSITQTQISDPSAIAEVIVEKESKKDDIIEKESKKDDIVEIEKEPQKEDIAEKESKEEDIVEVENEPQKEDIVEKESKTDDIVEVEKEPNNEDIVEVESKKDDIVEVEKEPNKEGVLIEDQFRQEFWSLIHKRDPRMDSYHNLFVNNKGKVKCEEYEYLRLVILNSAKAYKEWYHKLKTLPESQLQNIETIAALKDALNNNINDNI